MNLRDTEDLKALPYAAVGAVEGVYKYYVRPALTAKKAWLVMGLGILAYEVAAPGGELLSQGVDRAIEVRPLLTRAAIGYVALHLMNLLPESCDLIHQSTRMFGK